VVILSHTSPLLHLPSISQISDRTQDVTVTLELAVKRSNHSARSHKICTKGCGDFQLLDKPWPNLIILKGEFSGFFYFTLFNTTSSAAHHIPQCGTMLGSNQGLLRVRH
jgi:hypothetical protein